MKNKKLEDYLLANPAEKPFAVAKRFKLSERTVRGYRQALGLTPFVAELPVKPLTETHDEMQTKVHQHLKKNRGKDHTIEELSDHFNVGISQIVKAIAALRDKGHTIKAEPSGISLAFDVAKSLPTSIDPKHFKGGWFRFGVLGDTHLCSRYSRLDVLNSLYDLYEREGITEVLHTGNIVDGEARFNRYDLLAHGIDGQSEYLAKTYPQRKGIVTKFIGGDDHEGWWTQNEGIDVGRYIQRVCEEHNRKDLVYLGYMEHDLVLKAPKGNTIIRVLHPGGGSSYATSYTVQKIVESYSGGEKPHILLAGHYHKADYTYVRGVHAVQTGTTQDQTPFMRKKRLAAHLGGWIIEFQQGDDGSIRRFRQEFIPFFDTGYHEKQWSHKIR